MRSTARLSCEFVLNHDLGLLAPSRSFGCRAMTIHNTSSPCSVWHAREASAHPSPGDEATRPGSGNPTSPTQLLNCPDRVAPSADRCAARPVIIGSFCSRIGPQAAIQCLLLLLPGVLPLRSSESRFSCFARRVSTRLVSSQSRQFDFILSSQPIASLSRSLRTSRFFVQDQFEALKREKPTMHVQDLFKEIGAFASQELASY